LFVDHERMGLWPLAQTSMFFSLSALILLFYMNELCVFIFQRFTYVSPKCCKSFPIICENSKLLQCFEWSENFHFKHKLWLKFWEFSLLVYIILKYTMMVENLRSQSKTKKSTFHGNLSKGLFCNKIFKCSNLLNFHIGMELDLTSFIS